MTHNNGLIRRMGATLVASAAALTLYAAPVRADKVTVETFGSQKGVLLEVKAGTGVGDKNLNLQYFTRVRRFRGYDDKNASFMQNELSLGDLVGLRLVGQGRLAEDKLVPQAGVSYSTALGSGRGYVALTSNLESPRLAELLLNASQHLTSRISVEAEQVLWANEQVRKGSSRAHLGLKVTDGITVGAATEVDYGRGLPTQYKAGVFVRVGGK